MQLHDIVNSEYNSALERAQAIVGDDATMLLLYFCMADFYQSQSNFKQAECFNRRSRHLIINAPKGIEGNQTAELLNACVPHSPKV